MSEPKGKVKIETLLKGICSKDAGGITGLRVVMTDVEDGTGLEPAATAKGHYTFEQLLRQSIVIAPDGKPALNLFNIVDLV